MAVQEETLKVSLVRMFSVGRVTLPTLFPVKQENL